MAGSIGSFASFLSWQGSLDDAHRRVTILPAQAGLNGNEVLRDGWSTSPQRIVTTAEEDTLVNAVAEADDYRDLEAATGGVTVVEPNGRSWSGVIVLRAGSSISLTLLGKYRLVTEWTLLPAAAAPA
jgi:hypothetical protein